MGELLHLVNSNEGTGRCANHRIAVCTVALRF